MDSQSFIEQRVFSRQKWEPRSHTVSGGVVMVQFSGPPGAIREERTLTDVLCCHQTVTEKLLIVTTKIVNFSQMKIEEYHALIL